MWVIAIGRDISWAESKTESLSARSVNILNNNFYADRADIRFGIVEYSEWNDIKEALYATGPGYVVLKDGEVYHPEPGKESYVSIHKFIEKTIPDGEYQEKYTLSGRMTPVGIYFNNAMKEARRAQKQVPIILVGWLKHNGAPDWCYGIVQWYATQDVNIQLLINILILAYLIAIQFYFFRYMVCDACFREYQQLTDDVEESERTLDERRKQYQEYLKKKELEMKEKEQKIQKMKEEL